MANLVPWLTQKFFDANGLPLEGGKLHSYEAGTTTPLATYTDATGGTPNTNPVILDANGEASIRIGQDAYKFVLTDADDVELKTWDGVQLIAPSSVTTSKIADGAVTTPKIANAAVTTDKINNLAVTTAKIANLAVTTGKINDGAVTSQKLADDAVTPAKLADSIYSDVFSERDKIINGDMSFWQRAAAHIGVLNKAFTADRWQFNKSGTMVYDVERDTSVPAFGSPDNAQFTFTNSMKISCTTEDGTVAAGDLVEIGQPIEGYFFRDILLKNFVFSFWVKANKAATYCIAFKNKPVGAVSPPTRSYVKEFEITTPNIWQKVIIPVPAPATGTWAGGMGVTGLYASFVLTAGSTYQTTADSWQNGNYSGTSTMDNFSDDDTNEMWITGVRLEQGSIPRQYVARDAE